MTVPRSIILGTRPSQLARRQTETVLGWLQAAWPGFAYRVVTLTTEGDQRLDRPLPEIGGKGVFTADLEAALRSGAIDLAVHSLKDLPIEPAPGLCVGAVSARADARDALVSARGEKFAGLPAGARIGTSSLRRQAQLRAARPDLSVLSIRGNVDTRLRKAHQGEVDAVVLAAAGIERLELGSQVSEYLPYEIMLPAPGQGALAVQCRDGEPNLLELLAPIHDLPAYRAVTAERAFLAGLGGGCSAPVAALAVERGGEIEMRGLVASPDGTRVIRVAGARPDPAALGDLLARQALGQGAAEILS